MTPDQLPLEEFLEEADDLVQELESSLLELESNLDDRSIVDRIFRAMHTIKGGAGMVMQSELSCLLYTSPSPRDRQKSRMPSSA